MKTIPTSKIANPIIKSHAIMHGIAEIVLIVSGLNTQIYRAGKHYLAYTRNGKSLVSSKTITPAKWNTLLANSNLRYI